MIYDRRKLGKNSSVGNRQRFLDRHKHSIKKEVDIIGRRMTFKDALRSKKVSIPKRSLQEPKFNLDPKTGQKSHVLTGNDKYRKGDRLKKPPNMSGGRGNGGSPDGDGEDEFAFTLTKEEFMDIYFQDMDLPEFVKEATVGSNKYKLARAGYTKDGIPARINIQKSFENAIARRIATRYLNKEEDKDKKPRFIDDEDLRYNHFEKKPYPVRQAVIFCIMDTSASMGQHEKDIAKRFFMLLYLFLHKSYDEIVVRFIRHTTEAAEVDEETFFGNRATGGTMVSTALHLVDDIIEEEYNPDEINIYIAQASDGDNFAKDNNRLVDVVADRILPIVQYYAYIQIESPDRIAAAEHWGITTVIECLREAAGDSPKLQCRSLYEQREVYPVLQDLFRKKS